MSKHNKSLKTNKISNKHIIHKKNKLPWKKIIVSIIFIFCIVLIGFLIIINKYLGKINKVAIDRNDLNITEDILEKDAILEKKATLLQNNDIKNIVLFGIDETEEISGRSDCIMILTIDNKHKKLKLSSIIRDSYVVIPGREKKDKINHAYAFGGPQLALKTLNENFNLNLDQFVTVNFSSLPKIIDNIGGIKLDITNDELKFINAYINNINNLNGTTSPNITTSGPQEIDGTQALAYCRIRYTDGGDFERSQRHRTILNKLIEKCKTVPLNQYPSLLDELLPLVHTSLGKSEILSLAIDLNSLKNQTLLQDRFPRDDDGTGQLIGGIYYYVFDEEETTQKMYQFIFE